MVKKIASKSSNTSKIQSDMTKKDSHVTEEYLNYISHSIEPATNGYFKRLAIELITWAREDKEALIMAQFYLMKGISERTYYKWLDKYPELAEAHEVAVGFLANRREVYLFKQDNNSVRYMMPQYAKLWLKEDERRAAQKKDIASEQKASDFNITLQAIPNTKEVPERKDDK